MDKLNTQSTVNKAQRGMQGSGKMVYSPPRLMKYGSVASITGTNTSCAVLDMDRVTGRMLDRRTGLCPT